MYLRNKVTGAVTDDLDPQSLEYRILNEMRLQAGQVEQAASGSGIPAGGGAAPAATASGVTPLWEETAQEDVGFDPASGRVIVLAVAPSAAATAETTSEPYNPEVAGTINDIEWVPQSAFVGVDTNNRTITLQQTTVAGTSTVTRTVNAIGSKQLDHTVNVAAYVPVNIPVSAGAFVSGIPLVVVSSVNGTGLADPGGVLYATYTRA